MKLFRNIKYAFFTEKGRAIRAEYAAHLAINAVRAVVYGPLVIVLSVLMFPFFLADRYGHIILDGTSTILRFPLHATGYFKTQAWATQNYEDIVVKTKPPAGPYGRDYYSVLVPPKGSVQ